MLGAARYDFEQTRRYALRFPLGLCVATVMLCATGCIAATDQDDGEEEIDSSAEGITTALNYLEYNGDWTYCSGACANSGATGGTAYGSVSKVTSPNVGDAGHSLKTYVSATSGYDNKYFYIPRTG